MRLSKVNREGVRILKKQIIIKNPFNLINAWIFFSKKLI